MCEGVSRRPRHVNRGASVAGSRPRERRKSMGLMGLLRRGRHDRAGFSLYCAAVAAARESYFYTTLGVPDTLDGRFDMVGLHTALLIRRLRECPEPGPAIAQAVFDAMFSDMDVNLRESGVGDLSVGRKVRTMWEAFHGRCAAYQAALDAGDAEALTAALVRNVWRGSAAPGAGRLARIVAAQDAHLAKQGLPQFAQGAVSFLSHLEVIA
jgi:cytochrome b pre-mRNA-processing protein 3